MGKLRLNESIDNEITVFMNTWANYNEKNITLANSVL